MYEKVGNILKMAKQSNTAAIGFICMDYVMARTVVYAAEATNTPAIIMLLSTSPFRVPPALPAMPPW